MRFEPRSPPDSRTVGLAEPEVVLTPVDHLDRHGSGKHKRVIPLPAP